MLTLSLKNLTSVSSYLGSMVAPIRAIFSGSLSTSWISLCSLDLTFFLGAYSLQILSWSEGIYAA